MIAKKMKRLPGADDGKVVDPKKPDQPTTPDINDSTIQDYLKSQKDDRMVKLLAVLNDLKASNLKQAVPMSGIAPILKEQGDRAQSMAASSPNAQYRPGLEPGGLFDQMAKFAGGMEFGTGGTPTLERGSRTNTKVGLDDLGGGVQGALDATRQEAEQYKSLQPGNASQYDEDIKFLVDSVMGRGSDAGKKDPLAGYREPAPGNIESNTLNPTYNSNKIKPPLSQAAEKATPKAATKAGPKSSYGPPDINLEDMVSSILNGIPNPFGTLSRSLGRSPGGTGGTPKSSNPAGRTIGPAPKKSGGVIAGAASGMVAGGGGGGGFNLGSNTAERYGQTSYTGVPRTTDTSQGGLSGSNIAGIGLDQFWDYRGGVPQRGGTDATGGALTELANKYGVDEDRIVRKQGGGGGKGGFRGMTGAGGGGGGSMASIAMKAMKAGGLPGAELIQVGERSPTDKNYQTSEVVLAAPGTVVAPIPKGMGTPSREDALGLIVSQLMKHISGEDKPKAKSPKKAAQGTVTSPNDPYRLLDLLNSYGSQRSGYDLGRRGINRDLELGAMRNNTDLRGQDIERLLGLGRNQNDSNKIMSDEYQTKAKIASDEREGAAERALKGQLGNRGLDINASKNNNDFTLGKADQAFQRLMAGMRGGALSGVRAGRAPMGGAFNG